MSLSNWLKWPACFLSIKALFERTGGASLTGMSNWGEKSGRLCKERRRKKVNRIFSHCISYSKAFLGQGTLENHDYNSLQSWPGMETLIFRRTSFTKAFFDFLDQGTLETKMITRRAPTYSPKKSLETMITVPCKTDHKWKMISFFTSFTKKAFFAFVGQRTLEIKIRLGLLFARNCVHYFLTVKNLQEIMVKFGAIARSKSAINWLLNIFGQEL